MLWIALHLPLLSLESFAQTLASGGQDPAVQPIALMDAHRILHANAAAQALGVRAGLSRATALALAPQLTLGRADPARDARALEPVVHAALAFTPQVVVPLPDRPDAAPHTVLLEIEASLRYFGGLPRLLQRLQAVLHPLNHGVNTVCAPTAQAADLLARVHRDLQVPDPEASVRALDAAPVWLLGPGREHWETLQGMGLRTLGELRRMPRAGLSRRFGTGLLADLDRATGARPDPRVPVALPAVFESRLELFARADTTEQVLHGASLLLDRLVLWLVAQHAYARRFTLSMHHEARRLAGAEAPRRTPLEIALAEPSRDPAHLRVLLRERLANLPLPAPTLDLGLHADDIVRRAAPNQELFLTSAGEREGLTQLIERLQARLGPEQVQRLRTVEDHRPECGGRIEPLLAGEAERPGLRKRGSPPRAAPARAARPRALKGVKPPVAVPASADKMVTRAAAGEEAEAETEAEAEGAAAMPVPALSAPAAPTPRRLTPLLIGPSPPPPQAAAPAGAQPATRRPAPRPVWLLPRPEPLPERQSRPLLDGEPLQLLSGPERIEAGWWDSALAERDYFIAQDASGALVWIYRARLPLSAQAGEEGWFMQGRFG